MKNILVPTDFTLYTSNAFNYAVQIASHTNASLTVLHANYIPFIIKFNPLARTIYLVKRMFEKPEPLVSITRPVRVKSFLEKAPRLRKPFVNAVKNVHDDFTLDQLTMEYVFTEMLDPKTIIQLVDDRKFDLVVMGARERSAIERFVGGSKIGKVIDRIRCPLLAVSEAAKYGKIRQIEHTTSLTTSKNVLQQLNTLARQLRAKVQFVHIVDEETRSYPKKVASFKEVADSIFGEDNYQFTDIRDKLSEESIYKFARNADADVLSVYERQHSFWDRLLVMSFSKNMACEAPVPVLIFHEREETTQA